MAIDSIGPVKLLVWQSREIRFFSAKPDSSMLHLDKVQDDALHSFKMSFPWSNSESRHGHNSSGGANSSKRH